MQGFMAISVLIFVVASSVVGVRLLWLTRRTRQQPELLMGLGFATVGLLGYPIAVISGFGRGAVSAMNTDLWYAGVLVMDAGMACIYAFTATVFRPGKSWATALVFALTVTSLFSGTGAWFALREAPPWALSFLVTKKWILVGQLGSGLGFVWIGVESWLQLAMARRRAALGLADGVVANRFLLWVLFAAFATGMNVANSCALIADVSAAESVWVQAAMAVFGLGAAVSMYLAFLPPAAYLRWLGGAGRLSGVGALR
jgi:hypothetical protein